jgi:hypothetical protein
VAGQKTQEVPAISGASRVQHLRERTAELGTIKKLGQMMVETPQVKNALAQLSPSTHWTDIVGVADPTTNWKEHVSSARDRNTGERYERQHNSDVIVLMDRARAHMDMSKEHALMAEAAASALDRQS